MKISKTILHTLKRITNIRYVLNVVLFSQINKHNNSSYSQEGEDRVLFSIFGGKNKGFYIDVGAHHPQRFSNTCLFYNIGWRGINIDANKEAIELFKSERPRDININEGVGKKDGKLKYIIFDEPAINTFDQSVALDRATNTPYKIVETRIVKVERLSKILDSKMPDSTKIDFMSIDVEGKDLEVLESNNWKKYKPSYIAVEIYGGLTFSEVLESQTSKYLEKMGYVSIAKTLNTVIFKNDR